jgi:hypothetical protein
MAAFIQVLNLIVQIVSILIPLIKQIEGLFPASGAGKEKLALVMDMLGASSEISGELAEMVTTNKPKIETWISRIVAILNKVGWAQSQAPTVQA